MCVIERERVKIKRKEREKRKKNEITFKSFLKIVGVVILPTNNQLDQINNNQLFIKNRSFFIIWTIMAEQLERKNIFFFQNDIFNKALRCRDTQYNATFDAVQATTTSSIKNYSSVVRVWLIGL